MKTESILSRLNHKGKYQLSESVGDWIVRQLKLQSTDGIREDIVLSDGKSGATVHRIYVNSSRQRYNGGMAFRCLLWVAIYIGMAWCQPHTPAFDSLS